MKKKKILVTQQKLKILINVIKHMPKQQVLKQEDKIIKHNKFLINKLLIKPRTQSS